MARSGAGAQHREISSGAAGDLAAGSLKRWRSDLAGWLTIPGGPLCGYLLAVRGAIGFEVLSALVASLLFYGASTSRDRRTVAVLLGAASC